MKQKVIAIPHCKSIEIATRKTGQSEKPVAILAIIV